MNVPNLSQDELDAMPNSERADLEGWLRTEQRQVDRLRAVAIRNRDEAHRTFESADCEVRELDARQKQILDALTSIAVVGLEPSK